MILFKYSIGDHVRVKNQNRSGKVLKIGSPINGVPSYSVDLGGISPLLVGETDLELVKMPIENLIQNNYGESDAFDLVVHAMMLDFGYRYEGWSCLSSARLDPKPYQIFVAHRTLQDLYPRYILADEVGLGKTIEAGLIFKELKARGLANRVLIITPASLRDQWQGELKAKFNETFEIYDSTTIKEHQRRYPERNPWEIDDFIITSIHFARRQIVNENPNNIGCCLNELNWDLVIFDEAHHLRRKCNGQKVENTKAYRLGQALAEKTNSLLLLTATPMQLSPYEAFSLIELVDNNLFASYNAFQHHLSLRENKNWQSAMTMLSALSTPDLYTNERTRQPIPFLFTLVVEGFSKIGLKEFFWDNFTDACLRLSFTNEQSIIKGELEDLRRLIETNSSPCVDLLTQETNTRVKLVSILSKYRNVFGFLVQNIHKLSRVMIRNRKREVLKGEVVDRRAYKIEVRPTTAEKNFYQQVSNYIKQSYARLSEQNNKASGFVLTIFRKLLVSSPVALAISLEKRANRIEVALTNKLSTSNIGKDELDELDETLESVEDLDQLSSLIGAVPPKEARAEINQLRSLATQARNLPTDSKATKLLAEVDTLLQGENPEKILVFTQFRETQNYLKSLFEGRGYQVALFHSEKGSSGYSKRAEFKRFKEDPNVQIMISTEVGGEGLNLQFCHILFNYDLPWNPMRIEQRIGRLDRIGQKSNVHVYNFFLTDTLDGRILDVLQDRLRLFEETIGNLDPILGDDIEKSIRDMLMSDEVEAEQKLVDLETLAAKRLKEAREAETKMADFVMDRASFRQDTVDNLLGRTSTLSHRDIERIARRFLFRYPHQDIFKVEAEEIYTIIVPDRFRQECKDLYGRNIQTAYKGTFTPDVAIKEDTIDFFAFGHPLIDAIIEYCSQHETHGHFRAQTALRVLHHPNHIGYEGIQFNYIVVLRGVQIYKKIIPIIFNQDGYYDQDLSQLLFNLDIVEHVETEMSSVWTKSLLENLYEKSQTMIAQIAEQEIQQFQKRNTQNFIDLEVKMTRLFDYRLRNHQTDLKRREERLQDERNKQSRIIPAIEGQVKATIGRVKKLEKERKVRLAELQSQKEVTLESIELLNIAYVKIPQKTR